MSPFLNGDHYSRDLSIVNEHRRILPGPRLLHQLITTESDENLILDFLQADGTRVKLTYNEFHRLTDLLAQDITRQASHRPIDKPVVPVIIPQCPELYVAFVAVLKSGAGFCPVSHDVPSERLKFIVKDVQASFVLATTTTADIFREALSNVECMVVSLETIQSRIQPHTQNGSDSICLPPVDPSGPAYVMYTSGSTGLPKGVMLSHISVSQSLLAHDEYIPRFKRFLQFASPTFDVSIFEIFFPFYRGATLVACDRERMLTDLPATIQTLNADAAELTPTVAGTLLRTRDAAPCLTTLLTIGEMLTTQVVSEFGGDSKRPSMLYAMYGPTEAAIHCTLATRLSSSASVRSIGRPFSTVTAFILKECNDLKVAPLGEPGELAIAGQLADGYLNRPDQNQAAFVELPGYGSVYKTGDRAICNPGGELEILGRMSSGQVKLRGQRVELGEIEEVASKTAGVHLAIASVIDDVLVLFCAARQDVRTGDISTQCKSWLPPFMRPAEIVMLKDDDIPRLPSGKIDRKALQHNYRQSQSSSTSQGDDFESQTERDVALILNDHLGGRVDRTTSFWALGLDSLRAIKVTSQLRQKYPIVTVALMTETDNVAELSALITSTKSPAPSPRTDSRYEISEEWKSIQKNLSKDPSLTKAGARWDKMLPCSSMQLAMLAETASNDAQNFNEIWLNLEPDMTLRDLRRAFAELGRRNEILRSGFIPTGESEMPFAQIVWTDLGDHDLGLLHPLQVTASASGNEKEVLVRIHHALYDGWSWDLIMDDLNSLLSGGNLPNRVQFSEFSSYQWSQIRQESSDKSKYWRDKFQDFKASTFPMLSSLRPQNKPRSSVLKSLSTSYRRLSDFASSLRCSRETILDGAWALLLSSYIDEMDLAIGIVSAGRHLPLQGVESVIGPCLSTFPLRVNMSALRTTHDLINHIQRQRVQCLKFGNIRLRDINNAAGIGPGNRLFDTLCVWQQDGEGNNRDRSKLSTIKTHDALDYAIVLEFEPREDTIWLKLTYDTNLIPESHAELLAKQLDIATSQMMSNLELRLDSFWDSSSDSIMSLANTTYTEFTGGFDLTTSILTLADSQPAKVAVEFVHNIDLRTGHVEKETLTYRDLFQKAGVIASALQSNYGVKDDDLVCLICHRSIELYIAILGIIMSGAAYLCIDPRTPEERTRKILSESKSKVVLTTNRSDVPREVVSQGIVDVNDLLANPAPTALQHPMKSRGDELAYAVFTSGSTGVPKGVLITRRNLLSNIEELSRLYPCDSQTDKLVQACSPAFDVSVFEIFWTWHVGMTLCTASNDVLFRDLEGFVRELEITHLSMTPSVAALVRPNNTPRVKMLVTAGEPLSSKVFTDWAERGLFNGYGPSETTNICNVRPYMSKLDIPNNVGPVFPNTSVFICQRQDAKSPQAATDDPCMKFRIVPRGGVGEIWIGGEQVGRGYIDPKLTARSFYNHPQYGRLYRSGDIGRLLSDDALVILGREDDQVKLRGLRIELGEITSALLKFANVEDGMSMIINPGADGARLVSFWTPTNSERTTPLSEANVPLYSHLRNTLPHYMIPDILLRLEQLPLTRQGKIDRSELIAIYEGLDEEQLQAASRDNDSSSTDDDLSDTERLIARAVSDILGVQPESISRSTSFYAIGLDSINAIRVARGLRKYFPSVEISSLLRHPSIGQLMASLEEEEPATSTASFKGNLELPFDEQWMEETRGRYAQAGLEVEKFLPCTPLQTSMAMSSMNASSHAYQNSLRFQVQGNISKLRDAWTQALSRHQILRTGFAAMESADRPFAQVVLKSFQLPWTEEAENIAKHDLDTLMIPPWSLKMDPQREKAYELTLNIHHCLYDAEAMSILLTEVQSCYHGQQLPGSIPFDNYLSFMEGIDSGEAEKFWHNQLQGTSFCKLAEVIMPEDRLPSATNSMAMRNASLSLSELHKHVANISTTALTLLQTAWSRLLFCIFQREDICFGNVLSGRNLPIDGVDRMVAPCFNTLPMRARSQRGGSNRELCNSIQQMNVEVLPFQPCSLRKIQQQNSADGRSLFDTLVLLQQEDLQLDDQIWSLSEESGDMSFPFIFEIIMDAKGDMVSLRLHSEVASSNILERLLECFDSFLLHTAKFPEARALDHSFVSERFPNLRPLKDTLSYADGATNVQVNGSPGANEELTQTEQSVKDILMQLKPANSTRIFRDTTIFRLGFDSINAVQIAARLRKQGFKISSADILEAASIQGIAGVCESQQEDPKEPSLFDLKEYSAKHRNLICRNNNIDEARVESVRPATPTQSGILSQFLRSNGRLYLNSVHLNLDKSVDLSRLRDAWLIAMERHEMLRTGFAETEDPKSPFVMITYLPNAVPLPWLDRPIATNGESTTMFEDGTRRLIEPNWSLTVSGSGSAKVLELSILHALYDAQSLDIILNDVAHIYSGEQLPRAPALDSTISKILGTSRDEGSRTFWSEMSVDLYPTCFPDMRVYSHKSEQFRVVTERCSLSNSDLEIACAEAGTTLQAVVATAWSIILSAYTAQDRVTFGLILSGRTFDEEDNGVAFPCINTLPLGFEVSQNHAQVLKAATKRCAGIMRHQHTPLSSIKRWAGIEDELFDTVIVLQKYDAQKGPTRPWSIAKDDASAEYTVSLEIIPQVNNDVELQLTFREDIVPQEQAAYILREVEAVIKHLLSSTAEDSRLFSVVPAKEERITSDVRFLHEFVEETAARKPNSVALEFVTSLSGSAIEKQTWTYSQLNSKGNQLARLVLEKGAKVGDLIAVCFDKCPEASFAILGALKAGCGYIAIDPGAPKTRKEFILQDSGCHIVLTTSDKISDFESVHTLELLSVDDKSWESLSDETPELSSELDHQGTSYCLYTSGTTGTPKGCLISHDSAVQAMLAFQRIFRGRWNESSRWLQFASFHFDVSVLEQYWSWSVGICVTSMPRDLLFEDLPGTINALQITHLDLTPSLARLLTPEDVPSLCDGVFIVGGEQVRQDILETWGDTQCLYNFYGPSEVTIGCTVHQQVPKDAKPTNIGQQWVNVGSFVLEPASQKPVLRGAIGELCLSGPLVGKGYLNRPDLTAEKFITLAEQNTRVYRTGDLVRLLHDDSFEFLGRIDDQVKLRGQRLEIGEINHVAMSADPGIKDVATMVLKHPTQQKDQLVAFFSTAERRKRGEQPSVVSNRGTLDLIMKIQKTCSSKMPAYMVPTYFLAVSSMPLSANNKVDHKALKALFERTPLESGGASSSGEQESSSETFNPDNEVVGILADFLQVPPTSIKPGSRLFELGLDSISVISLSKIFKRRGLKNSDVATILKHSVVRDLARVVGGESTTDQNQLVAIARRSIQTFADKHSETILRSMKLHSEDVENIAPCTPLQEGMISKVVRSEAEDTVYFSCFRFEVNSQVDLDRLTEAWKSAQRSIAILRTQFMPTADGFAQIVLRKSSNVVEFQSLENGKTEIDALSDSRFRQWVQSVKSLTASPTWKVELATSGGRKLMMLHIFHGLYDGNSLPLLLDQVKWHFDHPQEHSKPCVPFYEALPFGPLRELPDEKEFWSTRLSAFKPFKLPLASQEAKKGDSCILAKEELIHDGLTSLCHDLNVTVSAFFQAVLLCTLQKTFNSAPSLGIVVSGRSIANGAYEEVIGPMFNTIPCAINDLKKGSKVSDLIQACHQFNVDVLPYQHTPLRKIAKFIGQDINQGLFDTLFVFQKASTGGGDDALWRQIPSDSSPDYPLNVEVEQNDEKFSVTVVAKAEFLDEQQTRQLLRTYLDLIKTPDELQSTVSDEFSVAKAKHLANETHENLESESTTLSRAEDASKELSKTELAVRAQVAQLAGVSEENLRLHRPTIFELGLDSIEAMKLAARLKNAGFKVAVSAIMKSPTVSGIASEASSDTENKGTTHDGESSLVIKDLQQSYGDILQSQGLRLEEVDYILPVTPMQEGLLLDSHKYLNVMAFKVKSAIDIGRLVEALKGVCQTQPILRTRFIPVESAEPSAAFLQYVSQQTPTVNVFRNEKLQDLIKSFGESREDLAGQNIKIGVIVHEQAESFLLLAMPHALYDAWSLYLLHQQVARLYMSQGPEESSSGTIQYQGHVQEVIDQAHSLESQTFWGRQLSNIHSSIFEPQLRSQDDSAPAFLLSEESNISSAEVFEFCKHQGVTLQSLGLACWTIVLAHYTRQIDVCFGLVLSGRTTEGSDCLIFPTFNTVVFRPRIGEDCSKVQALKRVHEAIVNVSEHQHYPLREAVRVGREQGAGAQVFNTLFTFQKLPSDEDDLPALYEELTGDETPTSPPYAVNIELASQETGLVWTVAFQEGIAEKAFGHTLIQQLNKVLLSIMNEPQEPLLQKIDNGVSICGLVGESLVTKDQLTNGDVHDRESQQSENQDKWSSTETTIRQILAKVAKLDEVQISKKTGIFHLGLDSVSAIKVASLLRKEGIKLPVSEIIKAQTIEKMGVAARQLEMESPATRTPVSGSVQDESISALLRNKTAFPEEDVEAVLPATAGQIYMLDTWSASNGRLFYPVFWLQVSGTSIEAFKKVIEELARQMPMLRTIFIQQNDGEKPSVWQVVLKSDVAKNYSLPWSVHVEPSAGGLLVSLRIHHALYDAVSFQLLKDEIEKRCNGVDAETELDTNFNHFISTTRANREEQQQFWTSYLTQGHKVLRAIGQGTFESNRIERFNPRVLQIEDGLSDKLKRHGLSIQALFFAAYAKLYASVSRKSTTLGQADSSSPSDDVVIGIYLANRSLDIDGLTELNAPTFNIVPLRVHLSDEKKTTLLESALQVQSDLGGITATEHCGVSMRDIHSWTGLKIDTFVNFLSLPGDVQQQNDSPAVKVTHAKVEAEQKNNTLEHLESASPFFRGDAGEQEAGVAHEWCLVSAPRLPSLLPKTFSANEIL